MISATPPSAEGEHSFLALKLLQASIHVHHVRIRSDFLLGVLELAHEVLAVLFDLIRELLNLCLRLAAKLRLLLLLILLCRAAARALLLLQFCHSSDDVRFQLLQLIALGLTDASGLLFL